MKIHKLIKKRFRMRRLESDAAQAPTVRAGGRAPAATFAVIAREWLAERAERGRLCPGALRCEAHALAARLLPALGDLAIGAIAPAALQKALEGSPLVAGARHTLMRVARQVFDYAVARGLRRANPALALAPALPARPRYQAITPQAAAAALARLDAPLRALLILALRTGVRPPELLALKPRGDVALVRGTISLRPPRAGARGTGGWGWRRGR